MATTTDLASAVRAWANGIYSTEAGVELLIRHGKAIYAGAPWITALEPLGPDRPDMAAIDVDVLLEETGGWSGSERRVVRIAASLLGGPAVELHEDLPGLDRRNLALVLAAVAHANGSHEHAQMLMDDDHQPQRGENGRIAFEHLPALYPWPQNPE